MVLVEARIDGIIDVGIIVLSHCENPAKEEMLSFFSKILKKEIICIIPYSIFLGAYHILNRYLKVESKKASHQLINTAMIARDTFHQTINEQDIKYSLEKAAELNIESWDGYLLSLMNFYRTNIIYSIDKKLSKTCNVINPVSEETMNKYYDWLREKVKT